MRTLRLIFVAAVVSAGLSACKKDTNPARAQVPATDALWALAPADTEIGVVAGPGTGALLIAAWDEFERSAAGVPGAQDAVAEIRAEFPPEVFDAEARRATGLDLARGAALFVNADESPVLVLPVADREAFRTWVGATPDGDGEGDDAVDVVEDLRCRVRGEHYVCADSDARLAAIGSGSLADLIRARPAALRGHIEVHVAAAALRRVEDEELSDLDEVEQFFDDMGSLALAVQLERGGVTVRGHLPGTPRHPIAKAFVAVPDRLARRVAELPAASFTRLRVPVAAMIPEQETRELASAAESLGVDVANDILHNLSGEMVVYSAGGDALAAAIEVGVEDATRLRPLVAMGCSMGAMLLPTEMKDQRCTAKVDPGRLQDDPATPALNLDGPAELLLASDDGALRASISVPIKRPGEAAQTEIAKELATGAWAFALYGYGSVLAGRPPADLAALGSLSRDDAAALWFAAHLVEVGAGLGVRDDGMHGLVRVSTQWANPEPVVRAFEASLARLLRGEDGAGGELAALAEEHDDTALGRSARAGIAGLAGAALGVGVPAAVFVPAFVHYGELSASPR
ncbi:hypothetical protein [Haliangium sp.]|uniref:hypothetical protein n=1 Tax=Haliangium sp. TaxID=2663208 RepID=UPI003D117DD8